ncbi:MAG: NAD-dependent epimerase/dehydratase family protein [Bacteroidota bacterium]
MRKEKILITGANGQIGAVLTETLRQMHGQFHVLATDIRKPKADIEPFELLDVLDKEQLFQTIQTHKITTIYHLAAILSAKGELNPQRAWTINMSGLFNILEAAKHFQLKVFFPSSIAVFGAHVSKDQTPQFSPLIPTTVYGISKVAGEHWCQYYHLKHQVDVRSVRYPGIIGYQSMPGGGTTDYAVEIYHKAVNKEPFQCFLQADTRLPMMYMDDAIRATVEIMHAPAKQLLVRTSYNISGTDFTPAEQVASIRQFIPNFEVTYKPDFRQHIADSWPSSTDDTNARTDWNWRPEYSLQRITQEMIERLSTNRTQRHLSKISPVHQ